jgi:phosphoglycolate phosphatase-like HAD superfamily hydrolase
VLRADSGLHPALEAMRAAAGPEGTGREALMKEVGLLDDQMIQAVHNKVAKIAGGGQFVRPQDAARFGREAQTSGNAAVQAVERGEQAKVRGVARAMTQAGAGLDKAERAHFHRATTTTGQEREAAVALKQAQAQGVRAQNVAASAKREPHPGHIATPLHGAHKHRATANVTPGRASAQ